MKRATLYFAAIGLAAICLYGCASAKKGDTITVAPTTQAASQPVSIDASQITAQVVAQARQELKADVRAELSANATGIGSVNTEFGWAAAAVVILVSLMAWRSARAAGKESASTVAAALKMVEHVVDVLKLALTLSSEREVKRIEKGG